MAEFEVPDDCRYSEEDEWVRADGERFLIGITDYAQQQLGDIVFVELPELGSEIQPGEAFGVVESVKAVSDLYPPIAGTVIEVNPLLEEEPEKLNESCYEEGWIIAISADPGEVAALEALMDATAYRKFVTEREG